MAEIKLQKRVVYAGDVHIALLKDGWSIADATKFVRELPTAEVEPVRHGRWIDKQEDDLTEGMWRCSACGEDFYFLEDNPSEYGTNYCVNCGARMDGGADTWGEMRKKLGMGVDHD